MQPREGDPRQIDPGDPLRILDHPGIPERLGPEDNFYNQPPFAQAIAQVGTDHPDFQPELLRDFVSRLAREMGSGRPYFEDSQDLGEIRARISPWRFRDLARAAGARKIDQQTAIGLGVSLLEALQRYPKWAAYITSQINDYKADGAPVASYPRKVRLGPAETYCHWVKGQLEADERYKLWGIKEVLPKGYPSDHSSPQAPEGKGLVNRQWQQRRAAETLREKRD